MIEQYRFIQIADDAPELPEQLETKTNTGCILMVSSIC
jgi:hypothetical protein